MRPVEKNKLIPYFSFSLGNTYGSFKEELDLFSIDRVRLNDPGATISFETKRNFVPNTYRKVIEKTS